MRYSWIDTRLNYCGDGELIIPAYTLNHECPVDKKHCIFLDDWINERQPPTIWMPLFGFKSPSVENYDESELHEFMTIQNVYKINT